MSVELLVGNKKDRETSKAIQACNDWLRMGPGRSLPDLYEKYTESNQNSPPTQSLGTLKKWSSDYDWAERAQLYDAEIERQKNERRKQILETGLALDYERVFELKDLFDKLKKELDYNGLYYTDKKISSTGKVITVDVFNKALIGEIRGILNDIAKETGGRSQKVDSRNLNLDMSQLTDEQLERIANGEDPIVVLATSSPGRTGTET